MTAEPTSLWIARYALLHGSHVQGHFSVGQSISLKAADLGFAFLPVPQYASGIPQCGNAASTGAYDFMALVLAHLSKVKAYAVSTLTLQWTAS